MTQYTTPRTVNVTEFMQRTLVYLKPYRIMAAANMLLAMLTISFYFMYPQITQYIIDAVIAKRQESMIIPAAVALTGAFLLHAVSNALRIAVNTRFGQKVILDMRRDVYDHLLSLPTGFFDRHASGDLMTRIIDDVASVQRILTDGVERALTTFMSILAVLVILLFKSYSLTALALLPLAVLTAGALWYTFSAHPGYRSQRREIGKLNALIMDSLQGIRQIKAYGREEFESIRFSGQAERLRQSTIKVMDIWAVYTPSMTFAGSLGTVLVLWAGTPMVMHGQLSLGELVGFLFYLGLFYEPVGRIDGLNQMVQSARASSERLFTILDLDTERKESTGNTPFPEKVLGDVRYESVSFGYKEGVPVLKNISLHAAPGEKIALAGSTGAGKTSMVNLLLAFYRPVSGKIFIDSRDISSVPIHSLRRHISLVSQEPFLFNGTIRDNLLYGQLEASLEKMLAAADAANCSAFIEALPEGYETLVGERGVMLSSGEKQRISIARALLKDAPVIILDEATASVDNATEQLIQEALDRLMKNRTSFVIAHRLNTISNADRILVLHHGEIVEEGTHTELLNKQGRYTRFWMIRNEQERVATQVWPNETMDKEAF
jgi:ABC-type multidrug transport system fused ATPase/permease subunit